MNTLTEAAAQGGVSGFVVWFVIAFVVAAGIMLLVFGGDNETGVPKKKKKKGKGKHR